MKIQNFIFFSFLTVVGLTVYTGWIYGIVMEEPKFLVFVLILWLLAVIYSLIHLLISMVYLINSMFDGDTNIIENEINSCCSIFLVAGDEFYIFTIELIS